MTKLTGRKLDAAVAAAIGFAGDDPPHYSSDMTAAWQVVKAAFIVTINYRPRENEWAVWYGTGEHSSRLGAVRTNVCEAICHAALEAITDRHLTHGPERAEMEAT